MAIDPYRTTYLLIPLKKGSAVEDQAIICKSKKEAEVLAWLLGYRKFTVIKQTEMSPVVSRALNKSKDC